MREIALGNYLNKRIQFWGIFLKTLHSAGVWWKLVFFTLGKFWQYLQKPSGCFRLRIWNPYGAFISHPQAAVAQLYSIVLNEFFAVHLFIDPSFSYVGVRVWLELSGGYVTQLWNRKSCNLANKFILSKTVHPIGPNLTQPSILWVLGSPKTGFYDSRSFEEL